MLKDIIPAAWRKKVYAVYALVGLTFGAITAGIAAVEGAQPEWLGIALAVYAFVGAPLGLTAGGNVNEDPDADLPGRHEYVPERDAEGF
jgi:hypothetical protein